jgi:putative hydrolase of the HAD superfamily
VAEQKLDAIFFDVDDTLYSSTAFADQARERAIEAMIKAGLRADVDRVKTILSDVIGEYSSNFLNQFDEVLLRLPAETYRPTNPAVIVSAAIVAYHDMKFRELRPYPDVAPSLSRIKGRGGRLGVVTQGIPTKQAEKLIRMDLLALFEPGWIFITEQLEMSKEESRLWREVSRRAGIDPSRAMYVGDHPHRDVDVPGRAGFITVLVKRGGKYAHLAGTTTPTHEVADFCELDDLLESSYGV